MSRYSRDNVLFVTFRKEKSDVMSSTKGLQHRQSYFSFNGEDRMTKTVKEEESILAVLDQDMEDGAGAGISHDYRDFERPRVDILQKVRPDGTPPGTLICAGTGRMWRGNDKGQGEPLDVIPFDSLVVMVEWIPKNSDGSGGGYVGTHMRGATEVADMMTITTADGKKDTVLPNGHQLQEQHLHLCIDTKGSIVIICMKGTSIPVSRSWNGIKSQFRYNKEGSKYDGKPLPAWSQIYRLGSTIESKYDRSWYKWSVTHIGPVVSKQHIEIARDLYKSGDVRKAQLTYVPESSDGDSRSQSNGYLPPPAQEEVF